LQNQEQVAMKLFALLGLLISMAVSMYLIYGPFTGLMNIGKPFQVKLIMGVTIIVQLVSAILVAVGFARLMISVIRRPAAAAATAAVSAVAIVSGGIAGGIAAGLSFGLTLGTMFAMAIPLKAIQFQSGTINMWPWWKIFGTIFLKTSADGVIAGIPLGIGGTYILSWILRRYKP
jgi:hypothetical protein